jgi:hypothetical protein
MDYFLTVKCPCCNENLIVSIVNDNIELSTEKDKVYSVMEISQVLNNLNIELG